MSTHGLDGALHNTDGGLWVDECLVWGQWMTGGEGYRGNKWHVCGCGKEDDGREVGLPGVDVEHAAIVGTVA
eukprot:12898961-Prorocentrum_lima.AAC.1